MEIEIIYRLKLYEMEFLQHSIYPYKIVYKNTVKSLNANSYFKILILYIYLN